MKKRYLVHPGWVSSRTGGDRHWIGAGRLMELYGVDPRECVVFREDGHHANGAKLDGLIKLFPDHYGDYTLPEKDSQP